MDNQIICLMGPTASGKTRIACEIVQRYPFEIISVDSAMIYREMDIGTAKPEPEVLLHAPHHLINILNPDENYSAAQFCNDVQILCQEIIARGKYPLLVGGTMMYFRALQQGLSALPEAHEKIRNELLDEANRWGWEHMHSLLKKVDPSSAAWIHTNDRQRIQRALEVYRVTGIPISEMKQRGGLTNQMSFVNLILMPSERVWLHHQINERFTQMLENGLVEEVQGLLQRWKLNDAHPSMRCVGYRQVWEYLKNEYNFTTLKEKGAAATRQLAKRQLTWLRHWPSGTFFTADKKGVEHEIMAIMNKILDNSSQIGD